jgi:hypothetical protein
VLPKAESMKQDGKSRHTFLLDWKTETEYCALYKP